MKLIKYTKFLVMTLIGFYLLACSSAYRKAAPEMAEMDSISMRNDSFAKETYQFENDTLSPSALKAFELRAGQILQDAADYMQMLADPNIERPFKSQAKQMMLDVFADATNMIEINIASDAKPLKMEVTQLTDSLLSNQFPIKIEIQNVRVGKSLVQKKQGTYDGQLTFLQTVYRINKPENIRLNIYQMNVTISLKRVTKEFGSTTKEVWQVFLGNIETY
jgi:hypothetical protein